MEFEVHMYMAVGSADGSGVQARGDLHPMLIFVRQPAGETHDFEAARAAASADGWSDLDFTRAGTLPADAAGSMEPAHRACYLEALEKGASVSVYPTVVKRAPAKA